LSFQEADLLSTQDKEFIRALFPETPLYTFLLPEEVRAAIAAVGENTRGAVHLLERAGMKFLGHVDPFDGGPYYGAATADLIPVKMRRVVTAIAGEAAEQLRSSYLVAVENGAGFRAVRAEAELRGEDRVVVAPEVLSALGVAARARLDLVPLP
jgi:arginine N-succinyltransferase